MSEIPSIYRKQGILSNEFKDLCDVTFLVGPKKEKVPAFRQILMVSNPVFHQMLSGEKFKKETEIEVPDFNARDFRCFLNFLYHDDVDLTACDPFEIYAIAHKYMVNVLIKMCAEKICGDMSYANIIEAIEFNQTYNDEAILQKCREFFCKNAIGCLTVNRGFSGLSEASIISLLELNEIRSSEEFLYEHVMLWTENYLRNSNKDVTEANKREVAQDLVNCLQIKYFNSCCNYVTSRYNWPFSNFSYTYKSNAMQWTCNSNYGEKKVIYGFKMPLSNLIQSMPIIEEFSLELNAKLVEDFKITVTASLITKDIYFKKPAVCEAGNFNLTLKFKPFRDRLYYYAYSSSNNSQSTSIQVYLNELSEKFVPELHDIFAN